MKLICKGSLSQRFFSRRIAAPGRSCKAEASVTTWRCITPRAVFPGPANTAVWAGRIHGRLLIPVSKGVDYVILVGRDVAARDLDLYVYDEVGSLILDDRRTTSRAGVKFRSSYSGTVQAYVHIARATGLAAYAVLVGRRGDEKGAMPIPQGPTDFGAAEATPR